MNNVSCQYTGVQDVLFTTSDGAQKILTAMREVHNNFGIVTVADFKDLVNIPVTDRDHKYGWVGSNLEVARVDADDDGYFINILPAMFLVGAEIGEPKEDLVNHPAHYKSKAGLETINVIDAFTADLMGPEAVCTANVIKYICRWKHKNGLQDLEKAKWYLEHLINYMKKEND